jgi:hypothetical protein
MAEVRLKKIGATEVAIFEIYIWGICPRKIGAPQLGTFEICPCQVAINEL